MGIVTETKTTWKCDACGAKSSGSAGWGKYHLSAMEQCPCPEGRRGCLVIHYAPGWRKKEFLLCPNCVLVVRGALAKMVAERKEAAE